MWSRLLTVSPLRIAIPQDPVQPARVRIADEQSIGIADPFTRELSLSEMQEAQNHRVGVNLKQLFGESQQ
jgi:hypothetical protein